MDIELGFPHVQKTLHLLSPGLLGRDVTGQNNSGSASLEWLPLGHFFQMERGEKQLISQLTSTGGRHFSSGQQVNVPGRKFSHIYLQPF